MLKNCFLKKVTIVSKNETCTQIAKKMKENNIKYVYVIDENEKPVGLISVTDLAYRLLAEDKNPNETKAEEIMTKEIITFKETEDCEKAFDWMVDNEKMSCLVVDENNKIKGFITLNDALVQINKEAYEEALKEVKGE